jgi:hypothetical protein
MGNTCVTATNDTACGQRASTCVSCGPGKTCSSGVCITQAVPACLVISPNDFDFGSVRTTCRSPLTTFTLRNVCGGSLTIAAIGLSGSAQFTATNLPTLPLTLTPQQTAALTVTYAATQTGPASTVLVVGAQQGAASATYQTLITGTGNTTGQQLDVFNIPLKTDAVFVIDDSCSMSDKQIALGSNAPSLFAYPISANVDFNVGVTTTDFSPDGGSCIPGLGCFGSTGPRGAFIADGGAPYVLRSTTPNLLPLFDQRVRVGTNGSGTETMFAPSVASVQAPLITTGVNTGFLRTDSNLSYLVLTDAAEQSADSVDSYFESLMAVRGWRNRNRLGWSAISPALAMAPGNCVYDDTNAGADQRISQMVARTGGVRADICALLDAGVWRPEAQRVGQAVFGARATWFLTSRPATASASSLLVQIAGVTIPALGTSRNWSYDATRNAVVFEAQSIPAPGQSVTIGYTTACTP